MKIAVIGSGISGLGAAYLLSQKYQVTVFEKEAELGGHSRTVEAKTPDGTVPVDTGFIVFNHRNYPHLTAFLKHLNVPTVPSNMSFGVSVQNGWLEYGTLRPLNMFAQKRNLIRPKFWKMLRDITRFNKQAHNYLEASTSLSLDDCLNTLKMGEWFRRYYLLAMGGAIWSTPLQQMHRFPAQTFLRFFNNHGLLTINDHPQWHTVKGGSREYVKRLERKLNETLGAKIEKNTGIKNVKRAAKGVIVETLTGEKHTFDHVVFACHSDQALAMIDAPTPAEKDVLSAVKYQPNKVVLHSDIRLMPRRRKTWSSWVYLTHQKDDKNEAVSLSYWMNNLQPLATKTPIIATLNPAQAPDPALTYDEHTFHHPLFDQAAIDAQAKIPEIQGADRLWFCGAWQRYGFHEDGLWSAVEMAKKLDCSPQWPQSPQPKAD